MIEKTVPDIIPSARKCEDGGAIGFETKTDIQLSERQPPARVSKRPTSRFC